MVFIIKPDNFWEKHKTSVATGKYKFDIQMISVDNLIKYIDINQILKYFFKIFFLKFLFREFGGSLFYDHDEWLEIRVVGLFINLLKIEKIFRILKNLHGKLLNL